MNKNLILIALASVLLAGSVVFAIVRVGKDREAARTEEQGRDTQQSMAAADNARGASAGERKARPRERETRPDAELVSQYGEFRTGTARHITLEISGLLDDVAEMSEMALSGQLANMMGAGALNPIVRDLDLTEQQRQKAQALMMESQRRNLDELKRMSKDLRDSPEAVMELILSGDAQTRGVISEEEHQRNQEEIAGRLSGILNPLDRGNFERGNPLGDERFVAGMRGILDEEQSARFQERVDNRPEIPTTDIRALPTMDLERLDQAVGSGRKLTGGLKQMMEGVGGLQDIAPRMENR